MLLKKKTIKEASFPGSIFLGFTPDSFPARTLQSLHSLWRESIDAAHATGMGMATVITYLSNIVADLMAVAKLKDGQDERYKQICKSIITHCDRLKSYILQEM